MPRPYIAPEIPCLATLRGLGPFEARRGGSEISDALVAPRSGQREHDALRVAAVHDPIAPRHRNRTIEDATATCLHTGRCRVGVTHVEIVEPERHRDAGGLGVHAA